MREDNIQFPMETLSGPKPLTPDALFRPCDTGKFQFQTTAEVDGLTESIGHERASEALEFGVGMRKRGFNLFLLGPAGTGKHTIARHFLERRAANEITPAEWCYVNNFDTTENPRRLMMPAGRGGELRDDMHRLVEDLRSAIPAAFESENYRARKHVIEQEIKDRQEKAFDDLQEEANAKGIAVLRTPTGLILAPMKNGEVMKPDDFEHLPEEEHQKIEATILELQEKVRSVLLQAPKWDQEGRERVRQLNGEVAIFAVGHLIDELRKKYPDLPQVIQFLDQVQNSLIQNVDEFLMPPDHPLAALIGGASPFGARGAASFRRYQVNVLVERTAKQGAPVVYEDHPTYQNLVGQVEYMAHMGALSTDFNLIRPGALHRANGGYLILDALKLLTQPYAWDALKRCLRSSEIRIESIGEMLGLMSTASLKPEPIPLDVKVVLVGDRMLYYMLSSLDSEFADLFKVAADFEEEVTRTPETELLYAQWIASIARQDGLLPLDRNAVGRVIEHSSRMSGDSQKVLNIRRLLNDLLHESNFWATSATRAVITRDDVQRAIEAQIRRSDRIRERLQEETLNGTILIDTEGARVGQVNGLSVLSLPDFSFGHPSRITARVRLGFGEVIDIEREVELSGPIHSKGVLILSGFLAGRYAPDHPLSLTASLVFEQSYGGVEGDSASSAELYALLSALSGLRLKQSLAVTGSVNQHGEIQAIGGVNEKIEGFFDLCRAKGSLNGHGVLIPAANIRHLMLRSDVVDAVRADDFCIYAIRSIDEGMQILTGAPSGERDASGHFPEGSVNHKVERRLIELAEKRIAAQEPRRIGRKVNPREYSE
jgi:lon-related putative ATP-dependent protease